MSERIWDKFLTERDKQVSAASGGGRRAGFGKRPALIVIDVTYGFTGDHPEPILESMKRYSLSSGTESWDAIRVLRRLIDRCHEKGIPVIYTAQSYRADRWDIGGWSWKNNRTDDWAEAQQTNRDPNEIVDELAPAPQDIVILKQKPSAFFGTPLAGYLTLLGCDSLIATGVATSGCVRTTVMDAFSSNLRVTVVEDGCFDRFQASHAINLWDMHAKYADVVDHRAVLEYLAGVPSGMFALPRGSQVGAGSLNRGSSVASAGGR